MLANSVSVLNISGLTHSTILHAKSYIKRKEAHEEYLGHFLKAVYLYIHAIIKITITLTYPVSLTDPTYTCRIHREIKVHFKWRDRQHSRSADFSGLFREQCPEELGKKFVIFHVYGCI